MKRIIRGQLSVAVILTAVTLAAPFVPVAYADKYSDKWYTPLTGDCSGLIYPGPPALEVLGSGLLTLYDKENNPITTSGDYLICTHLNTHATSLTNTYAKPHSWAISMRIILVSCSGGVCLPTTLVQCDGTGDKFPGTVTCDAGVYGSAAFTVLRPGH